MLRPPMPRTKRRTSSPRRKKVPACQLRRGPIERGRERAGTGGQAAAAAAVSLGAR